MVNYKNVLFLGEPEKLCEEAADCIVKNPICFDDLLEIIQLSGRLARQGLKPKNILEEKFDYLAKP